MSRPILEQSIILAACSAAALALGSAVAACAGASGIDSINDHVGLDASPLPPTPETDAAADAAANAPTGVASFVDAGLSFDVSSLPPMIQQCGTCIDDTCAPQISACESDPDCKSLLVCSIESGCITASEPAACIATCGTDAGMTPKEILEATKLLESIATACGACVSKCPLLDASAR